MKAIILLSGGVDSTVMLAMAIQQRKECVAVSFNYGQRHKIELTAAKEIAAHYQVPHQIETINQSFSAHSALANRSSAVSQDRTAAQIASAGIPNTYVPARNTLFLAHALSLAEMTDACEIHFGANAMDIHPYPDCRPAFFNAFQGLINLATKQSIEDHPPQLITPLIKMDKRAIVAEGIRLGAPLHKTFSCYAPLEDGSSCRHCDACVLRKEAFNLNRLDSVH